MNRKLLLHLPAIIAVAVSAYCGGGAPNPPSKTTSSPKYHTANQEGHWQNQSPEHLPRISFKNDYAIEVTVPLEQTWKPRHYIEVIALIDEKEREIEVKTFQPNIDKIKTEFKIPMGDGSYRVLVKCNLHDMWIAPVKKD